VYSYPSSDFCSDLLTFASDVAANSTFPYSISVSYGSQKIDFCPANVITRLSQDMQKLAGMGVTVMISSGDDGSGHSSRQGTNSNGRLSPSFPASIPYVVAVGSTYFVSGTSGEEEATTQFGSGGGFSYDYKVPSFQADAVAAYLKNTTLPSGTYKYAKDGRGTPDVALLGEQFTVVANGKEQSVGGTSASSPSYAAIVSLLNEVCLKAGGRSLGFAAPLFYQNAAAFTDITKGSNAIGNNKATVAWKCEKGWDAATGLGIPDFAKLSAVVEKACAAGPAPKPPAPVVRYHCNKNTKTCAEQTSGHSTMEKCQEACK
jgi:tripeptidyl-peptidase-1